MTLSLDAKKSISVGILFLAITAAAAENRTLVSAEGVTLLTSGSSTISFEISVPLPRLVPEGNSFRILIEGFGSFSPPGAVQLPGKVFNVAIPQEGDVGLSYSVLEEESLGKIELSRVYAERLVEGENGIPYSEFFIPEDPWKGKVELPIVSPAAPSFMGRQRVLPVQVNPVHIAEDGTVKLVRRILVSVNLAPYTMPGGATLRSEESAVSPAWKRLYNSVLVNPLDVERFARPLREMGSFRKPLDAGKRLKLMIPETGLYAIRADSLIAAGLSPGLATGELALKKYYYDAGSSDLVRKVDVPILVIEREGTSAGIFDGADILYFYALGIKDDPDAGDADALYSGENVLWLEEGSAGIFMQPGLPQAGMPGTSVSSYTAVLRERKDTAFMKNAVPGTGDFYFLKGYDLRSYSLPFSLKAPSSSGTWDLEIRIQGGDPSDYVHTISFSLRNGKGTYPIGSGSFKSKEAKTMHFPSLPAQWLADGSNELLVSCDADYAHLVNDFAVEYPALFEARNDVLEFALGPLYEYARVEIEGFTAPSGILIEFSDPRHPTYRMLGESDFVESNGAYKLVLDFEDFLSVRRFIALRDGAGTFLPKKLVCVDTPSDLASRVGRYDALVISHRNFLQRIAEYIEWRRSQGYRVLTADVQDIYDEWNGGLPHPDAIKRFIKYGLDHWGVDYVLLVGDASEDHRGLYISSSGEKRGSAPDYVPSYSYSEEVNGSYDDETVYSDNWYAFLDGNPGSDLYPDVFIGRFPVGRDIELRALLNKIYRMETATVSDDWRRRIVLFSDDAWSGGGTDYKYQPHEQAFQNSTDSCAGSIEEALPGGFDIRRLYLAPYTDPAHPDPSQSGPAVYTAAKEATRRTFTPALISSLNEGCLFYMFQGHANRAVMTTESAFALQIYRDIDSLRTSLPFFYAGFGCHLSDFGIWQELSYASLVGQDGDCMSEQLLFKPGAGAASTYASIGFEYLSQNAIFAQRLFETFYKYPPSDSVAPANAYTGAHWILGEAVKKAEIEHIRANNYSLSQILRYTLLGDPMLRVDPGPPLIRLEADWGNGFEPLGAEGLRARGGRNEVSLRLTVSDVIAVGPSSLFVHGENWTDSLVVTRLCDLDKTYPRSYRAEVNYRIDPADELLLWSVSSPEGKEVGRLEVALPTKIRLFYNGYLEILPGVECPPKGTFTLAIDFPAYLATQPQLFIDGELQGDVEFVVPDARDSLHWEASFERTLPSGRRVFTIVAGRFSRDFVFKVAGDELVVNSFNFPNPFVRETNIVYTLNLDGESGRLDIYNVSGVLVRRIELGHKELIAASAISPHSIVWDGRDNYGDRVANGTYIYILRIERAGKSSDFTGKIVKIE